MAKASSGTRWAAGILGVVAAGTIGPPRAAADDVVPVAPRTVYDASAGLPGTVARSEGDPAIGDPDVDDAYDSMGVWRTFMLDLFERSSYDGQGAPLHAAVHGPSATSAYWDGSEIVLGDGDGTSFGSFARAPDVIYYSLTEPLVDHTADFLTTGEAGAVRVAVEDAFAAVGDAYDAVENGGTQDPWLIGESLVLPDGGFVRNMADPNSDGYSIDNYQSYPLQTEPHGAAGVIDNAFYLLAVGGTNPTSGLQVAGGIGIFAAGQLWYDALTTYATFNTSMVGWYEAVRAAAIARYGLTSPEAATVHAAFHAVGLASEPLVQTLVLGAPIDSLGSSGDADFVIHVPAGTTAVTVRTSGSSSSIGDVDLYVRRGGQAGPDAFDAKSEGIGFAEQVTVDGGEGDVYVHLQPWAASGFGYYTDVTLRATATQVAPSSALPLTPGSTIAGLAGAAGTWRYYQLDVPQGTLDLGVTTAGGSGNASLYLMRGRPPTLSHYGEQSQGSGNSEAVSADRPNAAAWYVGVYGVSAYSGLNLTATLTPVPTLTPGTTVTGLKDADDGERSWIVTVPAHHTLHVNLEPGPLATGAPGVVLQSGKLPRTDASWYDDAGFAPAGDVNRVVYVTVVPNGDPYRHWRLVTTLTTP